MKPNHLDHQSQNHSRRGSTLIIVIALLGLLSFVGMVFFSFATSERSAAEYFSDEKKGVVDEPDNVWDHFLRHLIPGPSDRPMDRTSILRSPNRAHSMLHNMVGSDMSPYSGEGIQVRYNSSGLPEVIGPTGNDWLDFVDSPVARNGNENRGIGRPSMDVDYTYPDINNMFLAYRGWAIRDMSEDLNGNGTLDSGEDRNGNSMLDTPSPRFERVPVIIPSFMRPQYMKSGTTNGFGGSDTPTDINWASAFDGVNRNTAVYSQRSFRPHPLHVTGYRPNGTPIYRYLTDAEAAALPTPLLSGGFPFIPEDNPITKPGGGNGIRGEMGIWTGSHPEAYELDVDNDGDGIKEGIWLDTNFPVQEHIDSSNTRRLYIVLHSVTIYDLDGLIDLNVHGNLAGLDRSGNLKALASTGVLDEKYLSRSNLGLGPHEVNPLPALRSNVANLINSHASQAALDPIREQFMHGFGINPMAYTNPNTGAPLNSVTQANMEFIWLMAGRAEVSGGTRGNGFASNQLDDLIAGRWGETERLLNTAKLGGTFLVADLPRPGKPGDAQTTGTSGIRFGGALTTVGRDGFDDNQDRYDGEIQKALGRVRPFGTPLDYAGTGRSSNVEVDTYDAGTGRFSFVSGRDQLQNPVLDRDSATVGPEQFIAFPGYSFVRDFNATPARYVYGQNGVFDEGTGDDLIKTPKYDPLFEDPLEVIFDPDFADRRFDQIFGPEDVFALHMIEADITAAPEQPSDRLTELAPFAFSTGNAPFQFNEQTISGTRGRFTTVSNSLHRFLMRSPFGADGKPGDAGVDDDMDGTTDELDEVLYEDPMNPGEPGYKDKDSRSRWWEFTADADGLDANGDGFPDGDGNFEFPPRFFTDANTNGYFDSGDTAIQPYSAADPFRPQVRRLLAIESGESRGLVGQMPLSPNHLLDVERNAQTPAEGTVDFLKYMQRAGMRFRPLTDHPLESETAGITSIPSYSTASPVAFPPETVEEREFWARRDRQKLARDIYVLLYTTGGAMIDDRGTPLPLDDIIKNYSSNNNFSSTPFYSPDDLRRMAQFAVNLVDAMDSDNVITKFEYDKNLGNGWNLDDDPYSTSAEPAATVADSGSFTDSTGLYPEESVGRGVVYGVEAQELAFSETLAVRSQIFDPMFPNSPQMVQDESSEEINFLHVELQNLRPTEVPLAGTNTGTTNEALAIWQLARFDRVGMDGSAAEQATPTQTLTLMQGNNPISGGKRFTIAMAAKDGEPTNTDPTQWGTADIYADHDKDNDFELVSPDVVASSVNPGDPVTPHADLDVIHSSHAARWRATANAQQPGLFFDALQSYAGNDKFSFGGAGTVEGFDLVLRRRLNPAMPELPLADNPWIEVDRVRIVFEDLFRQEPNAMTMMDEMVLRVDQAPSRERAEPIAVTTSRNYDSMSDANAQPYRSNTIGSDFNSASPTTFNFHQVHFDREFSSSIELLNLPVISPRFLTHRFERMRETPYVQVGGSSPDLNRIASAEAMFLLPDFPDNSGGTAAATARDNRWYRLLRFVEVPSRVHKMLGNYLTQQKFPGKININTLRHREVLAGLIDNPAFADVPALPDANTNNLEDGPFLVSQSYLDDGGGLNGRDIWQDFMRDRDGRPVKSFQTGIGALNFLIPGTPNARPFREHGFVGSSAASDNGLDRTLLRRMAEKVADGSPTNDRHWLEVANDSTHATPAAQTTPMQRHQILSKIMNNTTTVSNAFIAFGTAAYFEVVEDPATGMIQIGGRYDLNEDKDNDPLTNPSEQKSIFVIDRTEAFQAYDPGTGDFNWKQLVKKDVKVK